MSGRELIESMQIPDKKQVFATTSHRFKIDLYDFFKDFNDKILVEFGTSRGYTSGFCSKFFKAVHTINAKNNDDSIQYLKQFKNVTPHVIHIGRSTNWHGRLTEIEKGDVYIIDAEHSYGAVRRDTRVVKQLGNKAAFVVYDDYGTYPDIKKAVDDMIAADEIRLVKYIGEEEGWKYGDGGGAGYRRTLTDREGVICRIT